MSRNYTKQRTKGTVAMICAILAYAACPRNTSNFTTLLGFYVHSIAVKRQDMNFLAGSGVISGYTAIIKLCGESAVICKVVCILI